MPDSTHSPKIHNTVTFGAKKTLSQNDTRRILEQYKTIAIVGLSRNPSKDSYKVASYLLRHGYVLVPINPTAQEILGLRAYGSLMDLPGGVQEKVQIVDIFRPSKDVPPIVEQVIRLRRRFGKPHVIWMQLGIVNEGAAEKAKKAGLTVVMDKCIKQEHERLFEDRDPELEAIRAQKKSEMARQARNISGISAPIKMTKANFDETLGKHELVVVDCWAVWCGPCRMVAPIIDELAEEYAGKAVFGKLNVDENPEIATRYNVMGIPTLLFIKSGKEVDRQVGAAPKLLIETKLKKHI